MSRKYKFYNKEGLYFVSFATIHWIDVFVREQYFQIMLQSLDFCRKNKGMEIYTWCIMPEPCTFNFQGSTGKSGRTAEKFKSVYIEKIV